MDKRLAGLIEALGPVMNATQAEGFLHVTAFTCRKPLESLSIEDWPVIESSLREMLQHTHAAEKIDLVISRMRTSFLEGSDGSKC
ncbi:MAG TPA: hypothetical protein VLA05_12555 [Coriobacteriia bacterium]|nr:hypothetical protein [Coriobacteriia bacterium]